MDLSATAPFFNAVGDLIKGHPAFGMCISFLIVATAFGQRVLIPLVREVKGGGDGKP